MEYRKLTRPVFFLLCFYIGTCFVTTSVLAQRVMTVQVKQSQIRATPSYLGKVMAKPVYGERVSIILERPGWFKVIRVKVPVVEGWMNASALANPKVVFKAGTKTAENSATTEEVALAGKGFNAAIEKDYAKSNNALDYTWVDKMEKMSPTAEELAKFVLDGNLSLGEGE